MKMPQTDVALKMLKILGSFYLRFCVNRFIFGLLFLFFFFIFVAFITVRLIAGARCAC